MAPLGPRQALTLGSQRGEEQWRRAAGKACAVTGMKWQCVQTCKSATVDGENIQLDETVSQSDGGIYTAYGISAIMCR